MWLEIKTVLTIVSFVFIGIVISQLLFLNILLSFLLFMAMGIYFFGDMVIGYQISRNHLNVLIDPTRPGEEVCVLYDFGGHIDFVKTVKDALGKRNFRRYKKDAAIINTGSYPLRFINGNPGFVGHESYDKNVDLYEAEALDKQEEDDVKEMFNRIWEKDGRVQDKD